MEGRKLYTKSRFVASNPIMVAGISHGCRVSTSGSSHYLGYFVTSFCRVQMSSDTHTGIVIYLPNRFQIDIQNYFIITLSKFQIWLMGAVIRKVFQLTWWPFFKRPNKMLMILNKSQEPNDPLKTFGESTYKYISVTLPSLLSGPTLQSIQSQVAWHGQ